MSEIKYVRLSALLMALGLMLVMSACSESEPPAARAAGVLLERHFESPAYMEVVEVTDVSLTDIRPSSFNETEFYDVEMDVGIYVEEGYVISRFFTHGVFEVNEQWPEIRQQRLDAATNEEARQEIIDLYNRDTFAAGEHRIKAFISMVEVDNGWTSVDFVLDAFQRSSGQGGEGI